MKAVILSVGDELVLGQTLDTNSAWLSQQLAAVGCDIVAHKTVGDDQPFIEAAIKEAADAADVILLSGGLGPTEDDLTRQAVAAVNGVELVEDARWSAEIEKFFARLRRDMPERNRIQAMIPAGAEMIWNTCGTAAGIKVVIQPRRNERGEVAASQSVELDSRTPGNSCQGSTTTLRQSAPPPPTLFVMPGVPKEMKAMFTRDVLPWLAQRSGGAVILSKTLRTFGVGESAVADKLGTLMARGRNPSVGTTVSDGIVSLRINARFASRDEAHQQLDKTTADCRAALGDLVFGEEAESLPLVVARLIEKLDPRPQIVTAESCTGGLVAKMLTDIPGSSAYVDRAFVTYSNQAKHDLLGVPLELIAEHGAVSEPVARAMATGAGQGRTNVISISLTGIAGPGGGTPNKPVGTVWFALAHEAGVEARRFVMTGDREMIRDRAAKMALTMLRFHLLGKPLPF